ncbi:MAG TPA: tetratricopeptide repeat protein [Terriglobia bacterium]|nr:tetratricopeptide repeat protein [Terriglobia bacterium]
MKPANLQSAKRFYEFGPFRIDASERALFRSGALVPLTPKAFDTLLALVEAPGHILEKNELMRRVWPDTAVEENNLTQNISALRKALGPSSDERSYIETVPRRGYRFVVPVRERWEAFPELIVREHTKSTIIVEEESDTRASVLSGLSVGQLAVIGAVIVMLTISVFYLLHSQRAGGEDASPSGPSFARSGWGHRPSVAVIGLKNLTRRPDSEWLSTALSEMLTSELAAGEQLRAIPGEDIARLKLDFPLLDVDSPARDTTLSRIRDDLGTDYVVLGSFAALGPDGDGPIRLDLRLQDARKGQTLATIAETGTVARLFDLVSRAGERLRGALGVGDAPSSEATGVRNDLPSNPQVARLYADGLARLRVFDAMGAREKLEAAVAADPEFPLAHSALASALSSLGYDEKAKAEAKQAFELSHNLSRQEQLVVEGRYRAVLNQWDRAGAVYHTLFGLFPDNLDYGITLATAEFMAGKNDELLATLAALRALPAPAGQDPRIDLMEANWAESISDFKREQASSSRAIDRAQALGEGLTAAQGRLALGTAKWKLGQPDQALATFAAAQRTFTAEEDFVGAAEALEATAEVLRDQGQLAAARQKFSQTLAIRRKTGDEGGVAISLNNLALLRWQQGDLEGAKAMYDQALATFREIGDESGVARALNNIANIYYDQGQLATAARMYQDSAAKFDELGDKGGRTQELLNIGLVLSNQGDLIGARQKYEEAAQISRELGTKSQTAYASAGLGDVALAEDKLEEARQKYGEALAIRHELGEQGTAAETVLDLAALTLEEGHPDQVALMLSPALDELRREGQSDDVAEGEAVLARALVAQGKLADAGRAADRAESLAQQGQNQTVLMEAQTVAAGVESASGDVRRVKAAQQRLMATQTAAARAGFMDRALEARLALGEAYVKAGEASAGRAVLQGLAKDAQAKGFELIARKASHDLD